VRTKDCEGVRAEVCEDDFGDMDLKVQVLVIATEGWAGLGVG